MRQSFSYTLLITWVLITLSCRTHFVQKSYETNNISVSNEEFSLDSNIVNTYLPYKAILEEDMNRIISVSEIEMKKGKPESYLTNFLGDLLLIEANKVVMRNNFKLKPSVSYFNYGGIRTFLPKGEITVGKIFELMPFENEMVFLKLSGIQMQEFLNYIAGIGGDSVGGARFIISNKKAIHITIGGKGLDLKEEYWLVTNDYVANGGDGLVVLKDNRELVKSGVKIRDVIISHLEDKQDNNEMLSAQLDGRIRNE